MKPSQIKEVIREEIKHPKETQPIILWGGPGIGKSSVVRQIAQEEVVECIDIRALLLDPTDLRGIPVPENGAAKWLPPAFLPQDSSSRGVIFLDELLLAPPMVMNACLQLVLDRRVGEYQLPDGWCIVSASNRQSETIGAYRLPPPLANRFSHINFDLDVAEWVMWAYRSDLHPIVIDFIAKRRSDLLYKFDSNKEAYPTPRSWEFCSRILKNYTNGDIRLELLGGTVGEGAATELQAHIDLWGKLPDLDRIMKGEDIIPEEIQLIYAVCTGLTTKATKPEHFNRVLDYALKLEPEFGTYLCKSLIMKDSKKVVQAPKWKDCAQKYVVEERFFT